MIGDGVLQTIIGAVGGILATYIAARYRRTRAKGEYVDTAFDAYEKIMKRQDTEIDDLKKERAELLIENARLRKGDIHE